MSTTNSPANLTISNTKPYGPAVSPFFILLIDSLTMPESINQGTPLTSST